MHVGQYPHNSDLFGGEVIIPLIYIIQLFTNASVSSIAPEKIAGFAIFGPLAFADTPFFQMGPTVSSSSRRAINALISDRASANSSRNWTNVAQSGAGGGIGSVAAFLEVAHS